MAGTEVMWDAEPDTVGAVLNPPAAGAPSKKMTFLSNAAAGSASDKDADGTGTLRVSALIVAGSLALLWWFGGVVFKDVRL